MTTANVYFLAASSLLMSSGTNCVRLIHLGVPSHKYVGESATLQCLYDLEREMLYSVKWYKGDDEFFRYIPADREQKKTTFQLPGIRVNRDLSNETQVYLRRLTVDSAGKYRCEISAEAPLFNTVSRSKHMEIVGSPRISGGRRVYNMGDRVSVNCTSERSKPAATLHWYINNRQAPDHYLRTYRPIKHSDGLETAIMGLEFDLTPFSLSGDKNTRKKSGRNKKKRVRDDGFLGDSSRLSISLRCSSSISTVNSDEQTTETHHQKSAEHFSYGMLFGRGTTNVGHGILFPVLAVTVATSRSV